MFGNDPDRRFNVGVPPIDLNRAWADPRERRQAQIALLQYGGQLAANFARRAAYEPLAPGLPAAINLNVAMGEAIRNVAEPVVGPAAAQAVEIAVENAAVGGGIGAGLAWAAAQIPAIATFIPGVAPAALGVATTTGLASLGIRYIYSQVRAGQVRAQAAPTSDLNKNRTLQVAMVFKDGSSAPPPQALLPAPPPRALLPAPPPLLLPAPPPRTLTVPRVEGARVFTVPPQWEGPPSERQDFRTATGARPFTVKQRWEGPPSERQDFRTAAPVGAPPFTVKQQWEGPPSSFAPDFSKAVVPVEGTFKSEAPSDPFASTVESGRFSVKKAFGYNAMPRDDPPTSQSQTNSVAPSGPSLATAAGGGGEPLPTGEITFDCDCEQMIPTAFLLGAGLSYINAF